MDLKDLGCINPIPRSSIRGNLLQEYEDSMGKVKRFHMTPTVILGTPESEETEHYHDFKSLIGKLLFLASRTRPDIWHATIFMSQYSNYQNEYHLEELYKHFQLFETKS